MNTISKTEAKETFLLSVYIILIGVTLMLGALCYHLVFEPVQLGRVFYAIMGILSLTWLMGLYFLFWKKNAVGGLKDSVSRFVEKPFIVTSIFILDVIVFGIIKFASQRYLYLGKPVFEFGLVLACIGVALGLGYYYILKLKYYGWAIAKKVYPLSTYLDTHYFMVGVLIFIIGLAFRSGFHGFLLRDDELNLMAFARQATPFSGFIDPPDVYSKFYRPLRFLLMWVFYHLFGFDYAKYQFVALLGHGVVSLLLYYFLFSISKNRVISLTLSLVFSLHIYTSVMVIFVTGVLWWFGIVCTVILFTVQKPDMRSRTYLGLGFLLLSSLLITESGIGLVFAVCLYALYLIYSNKSFNSTGGKLLLMSIIVVVIYFIMRWIAVGVYPSGGGGSSGYFWTFYENPRSIGLKFHLYTIAANLIATFIPIFSQVGVIMTPSIILAGIGITLYILFVLIVRKISSEFPGYLLIPLIYITLLLGETIIRDTPLIESYRLAFPFAIHSILSLSITIILFKWGKISQTHKTLAIFCLGLILGSGIVALFYFRWRTHYLALIGWVILIAIAMRYIIGFRGGKVVIGSLIVFGLVMSWKMADELSSRLPAVTIGSHQQFLCNPGLPDDLVYELVDYYQIDQDDVLACR